MKFRFLSGKTKFFIVVLLVFTATVFAFNNFSFQNEIIALTQERSAHADSSISSSELYRINCAGCHGINRKGNLLQFPSLINIKEKLSRQQIYEQIEKGKNQMPSFAFLSREQKDALTSFLLNEQAKPVATATISPVDKGKMIFQGNCSSCHQATINDPVPPGNTMCMMKPEALVGATKRFTQNEFLNLVEKGLCYMPSFSHFTGEEKNNLWSYLETLEGKGEPERPTMGERCPMMREGKSSGMMMCPMMGGMKNK